jgi:hypothetical protein
MILQLMRTIIGNLIPPPEEIFTAPILGQAGLVQAPIHRANTEGRSVAPLSKMLPRHHFEPSKSGAR